jgi:antitoxin ParD1/3/4
MATMNISLPDEMKEWVEAQVANGKFGNSSDVLRDIIRREQERLEYIEYVRNAVEEGIASGFVPYDRKSLEKQFGLKPKKLMKKPTLKQPRKSRKHAA